MHTIELGGISITRIPHFTNWPLSPAEFFPDRLATGPAAGRVRPRRLLQDLLNCNGGCDETTLRISQGVGNGASVVAGQYVGATGNTGNSTGPHLHIGIRTNGANRCPQPWLLAVYDGLTPPAPANLPTTGCAY